MLLSFIITAIITIVLVFIFSGVVLFNKAKNNPEDELNKIIHIDRDR